jgi:hypothetical protein
MDGIGIEACVTEIRICCPWKQYVYSRDYVTVLFLKGLFSSRFFSSKTEWNDIQTQIVDAILSALFFDGLPIATHLYRPRLHRYSLTYELDKYCCKRKKIFKVKKNYPAIEVHESQRLDPPRYCELWVMLEIHVEPVQCVRPVFYDFMDALCHRRRRPSRGRLPTSSPSRRQLKRLAKRQKRELLMQQQQLLQQQPGPGRRPDILGGPLPSRGQSLPPSPAPWSLDVGFASGTTEKNASGPENQCWS